MTQSLTDKIVLVTGAGAGIGWGITRACVEAGATVVMAELNAGAESRALELRQQGASVHFVQTDVSDPDSIAATIAEVKQQFGRIDGLVNNAGVTLEGDFLDFSIQQLERLWTTNLRSVFLMCQGVARIMKEQGSGAIVNVSSNHALSSVPDYEMYAATKGGISAMSRSMCWSLGRYGIRVNTLCPGLTQTEAVAAVVQAQPHLASAFASMHADGRYCTVGELGAIAVFLLSEASAALTGAELVADHGLTANLCKVDDLK
ncbi:MAG: SDR family oxidoreductase [Gammaproteobacteria bacterium]|nr:SDR family oxidoreductase [Gammaproteobacteria bacterium]